MTSALVLFDDARARRLEPFALTRPAGELRAGAELIRRRWERAAGTRASAFAGAPHLADFEEFDAPPAAAGTLAAGTILVNARCAVALDAQLGGAHLWSCDGRPAAVRLAAPLDVSRLDDQAFDRAVATARDTGTGTAEVRGWWIDDVWDLTRQLGAMLAADIAVLAADAGDPPAHVTVLGAHALLAERGAYFEPFVFADTTEGPVLVRRGARIDAFTRLAGPCVIGEEVRVLGGTVRGCSIGEHSRVHGELSGSVFIGHANKAHDGFMGHSAVGRWVNVGAGTVTSNLKNSYGEVSLWTPEGLRRTGEIFLGAFLGDHVKLGVGTRLTTGCVVGAGANVFGATMPPRFVPPFAWGDVPPYQEYDAEKFLKMATRVMARRDVTLGAGGRRALTAAWARRAAFRG